MSWRPDAFSIATMRIRIRNGFDIPIDGDAASTVTAEPAISRAAVIGVDYGDLWPALAVGSGESVRAGQLLFSDRKQPDVRFTAPVSGVVDEVRLGRGGRLLALVLNRNDDPPVAWEPLGGQGWTELSASTVRARLLESGLWVALRARPYARIAPPDVTPRAVFVTAIDTNPLAPDPTVAIAADAENFRAGVAILSCLSDGPTYVCAAPRAEIPVPDAERISRVEFAGPHPAGLPGTHIHALEPSIGNVPDLWYIGYQDAIAIGCLFRRGQLMTHRTIAVCGPGCSDPVLVRAPVGAAISQLTPTVVDARSRVVSGSVLDGHSLPEFLGRYHNQITMLPERAADTPRAATYLRRSFFHPLKRLVRSTAQHGSPGGMLPLESFDEVWPFSTPAAALLRALLIGDTEQSLELGCRGLAEEDLALCTYVCAGKSDFGAALRQVLRNAERAG